MQAPWNPQAGLQVLKARFEDSIAFTTFSAQPIAPTGVLDVLLVVLLPPGVFQLEYAKWHVLPARQKIILNAWIWREKKVMLRIKFSKVDGNMDRGANYGMNIATDDQNKEMGGIIKDFAQGHAATQGALHSMTQGMPEI
jgi:hypothetical protein